jgi:glycosyltransferase involved in cell wall biosynthesis
MTKIAVVAPSLSPGDAVGNDILHMAHLFRGQGHTVAVFADHVGEVTEPCHSIHRAASFLGSDTSTMLVYHHSIECANGVALVRRARCRRVVRYHNVTPAHYFVGLSEECTEDCRRGRQQVAELAQARCDLYLCDSAFNQSELLDQGVPAERCAVLPPFHRIEELAAVAPDPEVVDACSDGRTNLLFVGRLAPNKEHAALIDAFALYHHHHDRDSRLLLIGKEDTRLQRYAAVLRKQVRRVAVDGSVTIAPAPTDASLKAYYACADVFVVASEHEGFCVPLVEAMALGLPIVGYKTPAILETVGKAGIVWEDRSAWLMAEAVAHLKHEPAVHAELRERGKRRYQERFTNQHTERQFFAALARLNGNSPISRGHAATETQLTPATV